MKNARRTTVWSIIILVVIALFVISINDPWRERLLALFQTPQPAPMEVAVSEPAPQGVQAPRADPAPIAAATPAQDARDNAIEVAPLEAEPVPEPESQPEPDLPAGDNIARTVQQAAQAHGQGQKALDAAQAAIGHAGAPLQALKAQVSRGDALARRYISDAKTHENIGPLEAMQEIARTPQRLAAVSRALHARHAELRNAYDRARQAAPSPDFDADTPPDPLFGERARTLAEDAAGFLRRLNSAVEDGKRQIAQMQRAAEPVYAQLRELSQVARQTVAETEVAARQLHDGALADMSRMAWMGADAQQALEALSERVSVAPPDDVATSLSQAANAMDDLQQQLKAMEPVAAQLTRDTGAITSLLDGRVFTPAIIRQAQGAHQNVVRGADTIRQALGRVEAGLGRVYRFIEAAEEAILSIESRLRLKMERLFGQTDEVARQVKTAHARLLTIFANSKDLLSRARAANADTDTADTPAIESAVAQIEKIVETIGNIVEKSQALLRTGDESRTDSAALVQRTNVTPSDVAKAEAVFDQARKARAALLANEKAARSALDKARAALQAMQRIVDGQKAAVAHVLPTFDVVRLLPTGEAVMAGRAAPTAKIAIMVDGVVAGETTANGSGAWALDLARPFAVGTSEVKIRARDDKTGQQILSSQTVTVHIPPDAQKDALIVLDAPGDASRVLYAGPLVGEPAGDAPAPVPVTIALIDIESDGTLHLQGRGVAGARVRVYIDNGFLGEVPVDRAGAWKLSVIGALKAGEHTVRADQLDMAGRVVARAEAQVSVPLPAEAVAAARTSPPPDVSQPQHTTVHKGDSLWRISRRAYGRGARYVVIYKENRGQIRDPDLIYPGQVFRIPPPR